MKIQLKSAFSIAMILIVALTAVVLTLAAPDPSAPSTLNAGPGSTRAADSTKTIAAQGGNITNVNLSEVQQSGNWQGYWGNLTSASVTLDDALNRTFYDWSLTRIKGEIYASRGATITWATVNCSNTTLMNSEEDLLGIVVEDQIDGVNETFSSLSHPAFYVGPVPVLQNSCPSTNAYTNETDIATNWYQVLLYDITNSQTIYSTVIEEGGEQPYFNSDATNQTSDFQLLVGANNTVLTYYFWIELG